jgi:transcriptional regulator GlxA family with amidase domain
VRRAALKRRLHEEWSRGPRLVPESEGFPARARAVILERIHGEEDLSVESLAEALNVSRSQLFRRLKEEADMGPQSLIRKVRIEHAASLLRAGAGSITEVAFAAGFVSLAHFSRAFREELGVPPSEYR